MKIIHVSDDSIEFDLDPDDFQDFRIGYLGQIVITKEPWLWLEAKNLDDLTFRELSSKIEPYVEPTWRIYELWDGTRFIGPAWLGLHTHRVAPILVPYPFILAEFQSLSEATKALKDMEVPDEEA